MRQPDLGRKIAELRKAQGLTQEELVEKCNLSVRTLQRIESGEVTPRSYTIKIIFSTLRYDYDSTSSLSDKSTEKEAVICKEPGQFYNHILDLFNLKTNTMKKLTILSSSFLAVCIIVVFASFSFKAFHKVKKANLVGTWQICNMQTGLVDTCYGGQNGLIRYKIITPAKFMNMDIMPSKKMMIVGFSGAYDVKDGVYTESIELTEPRYSMFLGQKNDFKIRIEDDVFYIKGINNHYDEMWKKVKE